jgi:carboxyl-terminal processing protease
MIWSKLIAPLGAFALLLAGEPTLADQGTPAVQRDPDLAERALIAAKAYWTIRTYFAHAAGLPAYYDFEREYRARLADALAAPDRRTFSLAMMKLFASLSNGHTGFTDNILFNAAPDAPYRIRRLAGRWTVLRSAVASLPVGSVVTSIDDEPIDRWLAPRRAYLGKSNAAELDRSLFGWTFLFPRTFTFGLASGATVPIDLASPHQALRPALPTQDHVEVTIRPENLMVIRIPSFGAPMFEAEAIAAVRRAATTKVPAILFDLRGNGGGSTPTALLAAIMTAPYRGTIVETPQIIAENDAHSSFDGEAPAFPATMMRYGPDRTLPVDGAFQGRIAILADGGCASACEDFVVRFVDGKRGPFYGEPTFGSTGQPYFVQFLNFGMNFQVSTKREFLPTGAEFEGVGVQPSQPNPLTAADLASADDLQLERSVSRFLRAR